MKKNFCSLRIFCFFAAITCLQQNPLTAEVGTVPTTEVTTTPTTRLEVLAQKGVAILRPIDYGMSTGSRIAVAFFCSLFGGGLIGMMYFFGKLNNDYAPDQEFDTFIRVLKIVCYTLGGLLSCIGFLMLFNISTIKFTPQGLLVPTHCLERSFGASFLYFFIPAAFAGLDGIHDSQIAYVDLITQKSVVTQQEQTQAGKEIIWGIQVQHTHTSGSQQTVYNRWLVIVLTDGRVYRIYESSCLGYNSFEILLGVLQRRGIPVIEKRNY